MERYLLATTTAPDRETAGRLARALVEERLAACVQAVGGLRSLYTWKGKLEEAEEVLLLIKTAERLFPRVRERLRELHPYEVPELVAVPIADGSPGYLAWMGESLAGGPEPETGTG